MRDESVAYLRQETSADQYPPYMRDDTMIMLNERGAARVIRNGLFRDDSEVVVNAERKTGGARVNREQTKLLEDLEEDLTPEEQSRPILAGLKRNCTDILDDY
jgi:hypothetical protein